MEVTGEAGRRRGAMLALLLAAIWIIGHPYLGIVHDGRIYAAEALRWLDPDFLADDILFAHGFQGKFTVFPAFYGALAGVFGLHAATAVVYLLGQLLWLVAVTALIFTLVASPTARWLLVFAVALLPGDYGSNRIFAYAEPYATPRPFAEGLTILGIALLLAKRRLGAGLALAAGLAFHPLVAWPGVAAALLLEALRPGPGIWPRRGLLVVAALLPVALAAAGVAPFSRLFAAMDATWFQVVNHRDAYALVGNWGPDEYTRPLVAALFVLLAGRHLTAEQRRLGLVVVAIVALGFGASLLLGEVLRSVLVINAQPWRAVWLLTVLANLAAAVVLTRLLPARSSHERWILALYLVALGVWFLDRFFHVGAIMTLVAGAGAGAAILAGPRLDGGGPRLLARVLLAVPVVAAGVAALASTASLFFIAPVLDFDTIFFREMVVMAPALLVLSAAWWMASRRLAGLLAAGLVLALALAIADRRTAWMRHYASNEADPALHELLPEGQSVFWESGVTFLWFALRRSSYLSCVQGSASIFNRELALAFGRRHAVLSAMELDEFRGVSVCRPRPDEAARMPAGGDGELMAHVCRELRDLDLLVLDRRVEGVRRRTWRAPVARVDEIARDGGAVRRGVRDFHVYDCDQFR